METIFKPEIDAPNIIASFQGWNDAGQAATTAVRYLVDAWQAKPFAHIDPEDYFSFTDTRPQIKIVEGSQRELTFAKNEFYAFGGSSASPSAVLMAGTEPNLRWRSFCTEIIDLAKSMHARRIVTLGSLITDAVHTRPVPLTGWSSEPQMQEKLVGRGITRSSYEGPTGIVGTLHSFCLDRNMPTASLWAATPFYLGSTPNPKSALALLETLDDALGLGINLNELRGVAGEFERQVSMAVRDNDEVREQIRALEERYDANQGQQPSPGGELPPHGAIIADLEDFLRKQRGEE